MFDREKYLEITGKLDLNFSRDAEARDLLDSLVDGGDYGEVGRLVKGKVVFIFGCGPSLKEDVGRLDDAGLLSKAVLLAADGAVEALLERGVVPDLCVTDLDGNAESLKKASEKGCLMIVHAHGDNIDRIRKMAPGFRRKLGTTQVEPAGKIRNFGGFTDGDRAAHLAAYFEARKIILFGMDFKDQTGKMRIGKQLLEELAAKSRIPVVNATGQNLEGLNLG